MDPAKIKKIKAIEPEGINTLEIARSFLGLCSYYRRFIKGFARITGVLTDLTKDGVDVAVASQTPEAQQAIAELIHAITSEPVILRMPRFDRMFLVKTDAAKTEGLGGVLGQVDDEGHERVIAYYGRRLTPAERNYTVTEIELLAALESIRTWRPYLWGRPFKLIVDHAALRWLHTMKDTIEGGPSSRLMRWILKLQEYQFEVEHKAGKDHTDADGVSRLVAATVSPTTSAPSSDVSQLIAVISRPTATAIPFSAPTPYRDDQGRPSLSRLLIVLDSSISDDQPLVYTWLTPSGMVDTPGAIRTSRDECDSDALLSGCLRSLTFPATLLFRIVETVTPTALAQRRRWASTPTDADVAVYVVTATREELDGVRLTSDNDNCDARLLP